MEGQGWPAGCMRWPRGDIAHACIVISMATICLARRATLVCISASKAKVNFLLYAMAFHSTEEFPLLEAINDSGSAASSEQSALSEEHLRLAVANLLSPTSSAAATATSFGK